MVVRRSLRESQVLQKQHETAIAKAFMTLVHHCHKLRTFRELRTSVHANPEIRGEKPSWPGEKPPIQPPATFQAALLLQRYWVINTLSHNMALRCANDCLIAIDFSDQVSLVAVRVSSCSG